MKRPVVLTAVARQDLREAAAFIAADNPGAARALRDKVLAGAQRIAEFPMLGVVRPELAPPAFRFLVLSGVPYVIVYSVGDPIRIIPAGSGGCLVLSRLGAAVPWGLQGMSVSMGGNCPAIFWRGSVTDLDAFRNGMVMIEGRGRCAVPQGVTTSGGVSDRL